jgi:hypothetical protein
MKKPELGLVGILLLGLLVAGCGGDSDQFLANGGLPGGPPGAALSYSNGLVAIDRELAGGEADFLDSQGRELATSAIGPDGAFGAPGELEATALVEARVQGVAAQGETWTLCALVDGLGPASKEVVVNIPTTLQARFQALHPELTATQSRDRVRQFLQIPESRSLESLDDSVLSPFLHDLFFQEAATRGGVEAFLEVLLQEMDAGQTHPFQLDSLLGSGMKFLGGCFTGLAQDFVKAELVTGLGWASRAMGINFPFPSNFDLEKRIDQITKQVTALQGQLQTFEAKTAYQAAVSQLASDVVVPSTTLVTQLQTTIKNRVPLRPDQVYLAAGSSYPYMADLVAAYKKYSAKSMLDELVSYLEGTRTQSGASQRLERLLVALLFPPLGIDNDLSSYNGYGAFSNTITQQPQTVLAYYLNVLEQTVLMYTEQAHNASEGSALVGNTRAARPYLSSLARAKKRIASQVPEPLGSDNLFVDRQAGLIWWTGNLGSRGSQIPYFSDSKKRGASEFADDFQGPGGTWRVPQQAELELLYKRIVAAAKSQAVPNNKLAVVLERWGWDISYMADDHHVWIYIPNQSTTEMRFSLDTGAVEKVSAGRYNDLILVSSFDPDKIRDSSVYPPLSVGTVGSIAISQQPVGTNGVQLRAQGTINYDVGGSFTIGGVSQTVAQQTVTTETMDITDRVVWSSSDESMLTVTNFDQSTDSQGNVLSPASHGLAVWQPPFNGQPLAPVTVTASFGGTTSQVVLNPPSNVALSLDSVQVFPYNLNMGAIFPVTQDFEAVIFYLDPATQDAQLQHFSELTAPDVAWSLTDTNGNPIPANQGSGFLSSDENSLVLTSALTTTFMLVQATVEGSPALFGTGPIKAGVQ